MSSLKNANMSEWRAGALATPIGCCVRPVPDVRIAGRPTRGVCHVGFHGETNDFFFLGASFCGPSLFFFWGWGTLWASEGVCRGHWGTSQPRRLGAGVKCKKRNMVTAQDLAVWPKGPRDQCRRCQLCHGPAPIDESRPCSSGTAIGT